MLIPGWFLESVTEHVRSAHLNVATVILRAPLDVCLARASTRPSEPLHDAASVEQLRAGFDDLGDLEDLVIDTSDGDTGEAAAQVLRSLSHTSEDR
jgi:hypothetical protein